MKEYFGDSVKNYRQPKDKYIRLFPNLEKVIKHYISNTSKILDIGCGDGVLYSMFFETFEVDYIGVDLSKDMITQAKTKNPTGKFLVGSANSLPAAIGNNFDCVVSNMLFPSVSNWEVFTGIFKESKRVLKNGGYFIACIINPYFDGYMQKMLFERADIKTKYIGYYNSPVKYEVFRNIDGVDFTFTDYHWKLNDYFIASNEAGLQFEYFDECPPILEDLNLDAEEVKKLLRFPNYLILIFKKEK